MREHIYKGFYEDKDGNDSIIVNDIKYIGEWKCGYLCKRYELCAKLLENNEKGIGTLICKPFYYIEEPILDKNGNLRRVITHYNIIPQTLCEQVGKTDEQGNMLYLGDKVQAKHRLTDKEITGQIVFLENDIYQYVIQEDNEKFYAFYELIDIKKVANAYEKKQ